MTREKLIGCIEALLDLDARKALVPHGIGGHARTLLTECLAQLRPSPARSAGQQPPPQTSGEEA